MDATPQPQQGEDGQRVKRDEAQRHQAVREGEQRGIPRLGQQQAEQHDENRQPHQRQCSRRAGAGHAARQEQGAGERQRQQQQDLLPQRGHGEHGQRQRGGCQLCQQQRLALGARRVILRVEQDVGAGGGDKDRAKILHRNRSGEQQDQRQRLANCAQRLLGGDLPWRGRRGGGGRRGQERMGEQRAEAGLNHCHAHQPGQRQREDGLRLDQGRDGRGAQQRELACGVRRVPREVGETAGGERHQRQPDREGAFGQGDEAQCQHGGDGDDHHRHAGQQLQRRPPPSRRQQRDQQAGAEEGQRCRDMEVPGQQQHGGDAETECRPPIGRARVGHVTRGRSGSCRLAATARRSRPSPSWIGRRSARWPDCRSANSGAGARPR